MADTRKFHKTLKKPGTAPTVLNEGNEVTNKRVLAQSKRHALLHEATFGRPPDESHLDFMKKVARTDKFVHELIEREGDKWPSQDEKVIPVYDASPSDEFLVSFKDGFLQMLDCAVCNDKPRLREVEYCLGKLVTLCRANHLDPDDQIDYYFFEIKDEFEETGKLRHTLSDGRAIQFSFEELVFINTLGTMAKRYWESEECTMQEAILWCIKRAWQNRIGPEKIKKDLKD